MNQEPLQSSVQIPSQAIWMSRTDKLLIASHRCQLTIANGTLSLTRNGVTMFTNSLATLQVNAKGYAGTTLVKNDQGKVVRLMFSKIRTRALAISPLIALAVGAQAAGLPGQTGRNIAVLGASFVIYEQVEARSKGRRQFIAAVAAAGGNTSASFADTQAQAGWSSGIRLALAVLTPIMCLVFSALIYAIAFGLLQAISLISPDSAFIPKVVLYIVIFALMYKPTYFILAKLTDKLSGITNTRPQ